MTSSSSFPSAETRSNRLVAVCPHSSLVAVYTPTVAPMVPNLLQGQDQHLQQQRIIIKCYDRSTLLTSPKLSLVAYINSNEYLDQLLFCTPNRLVATVGSSNTILVWDIHRGVLISPSIHLPESYSLLQITVDQTNTRVSSKLFVLTYQTSSRKLVVLVYDLFGSDPPKADSQPQRANLVPTNSNIRLVYKIKVGHLSLHNFHPDDVNTLAMDHIGHPSHILQKANCSIAVSEMRNILAIWGTSENKVRLIHLQTGKSMGRCKLLSSSVLSSSAHSPKQDSTTLTMTQQSKNTDPLFLFFSKDGRILATPDLLRRGIALWYIPTFVSEETSIPSKHIAEDEYVDDSEDETQKKKSHPVEEERNGECIGILSYDSVLSNNMNLEILPSIIHSNTKTPQNTKDSSHNYHILLTDPHRSNAKLYSISLPHSLLNLNATILNNDSAVDGSPMKEHKKKKEKQKNRQSLTNATIYSSLASWSSHMDDVMHLVYATYAKEEGDLSFIILPDMEKMSSLVESGKTTTIPSIQFSTASYLVQKSDEEDGNETYVLQSGDIILPRWVSDSTSGTEGGSSSAMSKKRKSIANAVGSIVLGPGEVGGEALTASDKPPREKKNKGTVDGDDIDDEAEKKFQIEEVHEGDDGKTIAERLAILSSTLEDDLEDEDEDMTRIHNTSSNSNLEGGSPNPNKVTFSIRNCTTDSLVTLLRQALVANDDTQLEMVLQVSDKKVIENSIAALITENNNNDLVMEQEGDLENKNKHSYIVIALLSKLVTRVARKPTRAETLGFWIRTILTALISSKHREEGGHSNRAWKMGQLEQDVAVRLGPLRNLLSERVESLPSLLKLEGRLAMLSQHHNN